MNVPFGFKYPLDCISILPAGSLPIASSMYSIQWLGPITWRVSPTDISTGKGSPAFTDAGAEIAGACDFSRGVFLAWSFTRLNPVKSDWSTLTGKNRSADATVAVMPVAMEPIAAVFKKVRLSIVGPPLDAFA